MFVARKAKSESSWTKRSVRTTRGRDLTELIETEQRAVGIIADASPHRLIVSDPHLHTTP